MVKKGFLYFLFSIMALFAFQIFAAHTEGQQGNLVEEPSSPTTSESFPEGKTDTDEAEVKSTIRFLKDQPFEGSRDRLLQEKRFKKMTPVQLSSFLRTNIKDDNERMRVLTTIWSTLDEGSKKGIRKKHEGLKKLFHDPEIVKEVGNLIDDSRK